MSSYPTSMATRKFDGARAASAASTSAGATSLATTYRLLVASRPEPPKLGGACTCSCSREPEGSALRMAASISLIVGCSLPHSPVHGGLCRLPHSPSSEEAAIGRVAAGCERVPADRGAERHELNVSHQTVRRPGLYG
eukprot:7078631-Prymnesium_polylepis.2